MPLPMGATVGGAKEPASDATGGGAKGLKAARKGGVPGINVEVIRLMSLRCFSEMPIDH